MLARARPASASPLPELAEVPAADALEALDRGWRPAVHKRHLRLGLEVELLIHRPVEVAVLHLEGGLSGTQYVPDPDCGWG